MQRNEGSLSLSTRTRLGREAFNRTATYDSTISLYLRSTTVAGSGATSRHATISGAGAEEIISTPIESVLQNTQSLPDYAGWSLRKTADLRYGENPHQEAALYQLGPRAGVASAELLNGKEMSFNNYVDADAAWQLVCDFDETACAIIKHMNPSGVGSAPTPEEAYRRALATDPVSAFGGIVAFNRTVDEPAARALTEIFTEVVVAPGFDEAAVEVLKSKKNLRILRAGEARRPEGLDFKRVTGGMLLQTPDTPRPPPEDLKVVTRRAPTEEEVASLMFAWTVCKHTKSNAIVYARDGQTVGVGAGQMSRVDSVKIGAMRAQLPVKGSVLASDAFFPFRDGVDEAARHGITAIIQPGGSVRDQEVIA